MKTSTFNRKEVLTKQVHYISGIILMVFIGLHLFNHCYAIFGAEKNIELMSILRKGYRNIFIEPLLLCSVVVQVISGIKLLRRKKSNKSNYEKIHIYSGFYLAFFLVVHVSAVLIGRTFGYDTYFYYNATTFNFSPLYFLFFPYYIMAILSFFGHIAAIHYKKMDKYIWCISPVNQSNILMVLGSLVTIIIILGQTNFFRGVNFPPEYLELIKSFKQLLKS